MINEFALIQQIKKISKSSFQKDVVVGIGDDCSVIKKDAHSSLLFSCDIQIDGVHFLSNIFSPEEIGQKAAGAAISDIAAMGGIPKYMLVSLILPKGILEMYIQRVYKGLKKECKQYAIDVIGGNISRGEKIAIDIFIIGEVKSSEVLLRSKALLGDVVMVTGILGEAVAGVELLGSSTRKVQKTIIQRYIIPNPRVLEGRILARFQKVTSLIDISDGLSNDIQHICNGSNVGVELWRSKFPISSRLIKSARILKKDPFDFALHGGEDYELCFTVPKKFSNQIQEIVKKQTGTLVTSIGKIIPKNKGMWVIDGEKKIPLKALGWNHFI